MLVQLEHDGALRIRPGVKDFQVSDELTLPVDVQVLSIYPHAHYLGTLLEAWATLPDGSRRWLIRIPDWTLTGRRLTITLSPSICPRVQS